MAVLLALAVTACANEQPPPGALPDSRPPQVARIVPAPDSVVPGFRGSATVRFDEPVRLDAGLGRRIRTSLADRYTFEMGFSTIGIRPRDGWREDAVYCFEIPEGMSDLLNNRTEAPIAFCFSTGPPVLPTRVEGRIENPLTGAAMGGVRVLFLALPGDSTPYTAEADPQGNFSVRSLPPGGYWAYGFLDRNRDLRLDRRLEAHDSVYFELTETGSVPPLTLSPIEPDSTPPVLVAAQAVDSLIVRLEFDDPLLPEQTDATVALRDSLGGPLEWRLLHVGDPSRLPPEARAPADTAVTPADTAADTAGVTPGVEPTGEQQPPDPEETPAVVAPEEVPAVVAPPAPDAVSGEGQEPPRPSTTVTLVLRAALSAGRFAVQARGFTNLRGLVGGGDTTFVYPPVTP